MFCIIMWCGIGVSGIVVIFCMVVGFVMIVRVWLSLI